MRDASAIEISRWCPGVTDLGAICILGRGIEKVQTRAGFVWRPTRYIEKPTASGAHSGWRVPANPNDDCSIIAGAHANVIGGCELFHVSQRTCSGPKLVIFAAGRPAYLAAEPDPMLTEGRVLREAFVRRAQPSTDVEIIILSRNRDTRDDIDQTIRLAADRHIATVGIITVNIHLSRTIEFARRAAWDGKPIHLVFIGAEELLAERYAKRSRVLATLGGVTETAAYRRTLAREESGLLALLEGRYKRS